MSTTLDNVFNFRDELISEYSSFSKSFVSIAAEDIRTRVEYEYSVGRYWPQPLIQINPNYKRQGTVQQLAEDEIVHPLCADIFLTGKTEGRANPLYMYKHQIEALAKGQQRQSYVVTTGTGSSKSLLDPADVMGKDYPSETFRVLKNKEMGLYGEYRTQRLVLEAWDKLEAGELY